MSDDKNNTQGSKYGAVDIKESKKEDRPVDTKSDSTGNFKDPSVPPKPAVRQRIKTLESDKPNDLIKDNVNVTSDLSRDNQFNYESIATSTPKDGLFKNLGVEESLPNKNSIIEKPTKTLHLTTKNVIEPEEKLDILRPYPKRVFFIIGNEFCERFSYYGLRTILVLYFRDVLSLSESNSTVSFHLFAAICYLTPILGAILGDSVWGKFKTILYLSVVYLIGEAVLVASSVFWYMGSISILTTFLGLLLIGVGTGGIKPCVCALGGDQFLPNEEERRQNFFSIFYATINLGSLISMSLTPMLRSNYSCVNRNDCYPLAFGLPCLLMFLGILVFLVAKNRYVLSPLPKTNVIVAFCACNWLAFKRRISGYKMPEADSLEAIRGSESSESTSSSTLSVSSTEDSRMNQSKQVQKYLSDGNLNGSVGVQINNQKKPNVSRHWLYLASDQFDSKTIGDFKSVWSAILIFAPTPIYWCLYDQQGSLWTLQATRMDGRLFNTGFTLQPDQIGVANPLLMLATIPLFQTIIYPSLKKCGMLTKPIQRMTVGGLLAALTFVVSALIELRIQQFTPLEMPPVGTSRLLIVNGLSDCSLANPMISYIQVPKNDSLTPLEPQLLSMSSLMNYEVNFAGEELKPLMSASAHLNSTDENQFDNYKLTLRLINPTEPNFIDANLNDHRLNQNLTQAHQCPLNPATDHNFIIGPLSNQSVKLMYLEQGNGKLSYRIFEDSLQLPKTGKSRVRLVYEAFGSSSQAERRNFYLERYPKMLQVSNKTIDDLTFKNNTRDGQVFVSDYLDVPVQSRGDLFVLKSNDSQIDLSKLEKVFLTPGTRSIIVLHQKNLSTFQMNHQIIQDNDYRISLIYQLIPYLMISMSEVMFSITALEFSYSMAPSTMKSLIMSIVSMTTAFGNLLTVAIESAHLFSNVAYDFMFYAVIMTLDMVIFAWIGYTRVSGSKSQP